MAVSKRLRYEVLRRDNHACRYCGGTAPDIVLTVDHVVPTALGGSDEPRNLVAACRDCNSGKSAGPADAALIEDVGQDALRWASAMKAAAERLWQDGAVDREWVAAIDDRWREWNARGQELPRPEDWERSAISWRRAGLDLRVILEAVAKAMANRKLNARSVWPYFCGICWRTLDKQQEIAHHFLVAPVSNDGGPVTGQVDDPTAHMRFTAAPSTEIANAYSETVQGTTDPRIEHWMSMIDGTVHKAWSKCIAYPSALSFLGYRTKTNVMAVGVADVVRRADGWPELLCATCCIEERSEYWPAYFGCSYSEQLVADADA